MFLRGGKSYSYAGGYSKLLVKVALFVVASGLLLYPGYRRFRTYSRKLESLREDVRLLEKKNTELRAEIEALENDPSYLEELGHKMGLVKDGEVVYTVREETEETETENENK